MHGSGVTVEEKLKKDRCLYIDDGMVEGATNMELLDNQYG